MLGLLTLLECFQSIAGQVELQDHAVMHDAIYGGGCGHRILEDAFPVAEGEVAGNQDAATFVAFGQQVEQDLHLFAARFKKKVKPIRPPS